MDREYPTVPITRMDVKGILKKIGREISWTKSDHLLTALNYVKLHLEKFSSPNQQQERLKALQITLRNAVIELDPFSNDALVRAGEDFAEKYRPESIEAQPAYDCDTLEEVDDEVCAYGSFERLQDLERSIHEVLDWISLALERKSPIVRQNSFHVCVIGEILPRIYEKIFDEKYTASINGPGPRFIQAVRSTMPRHLPKYSAETIVKYRQRMKGDAKTRKKDVRHT